MQVGTVDVVVVGAGLSGLICARELDRQGLRVRLLEARSRCGGRMHRCRSAMGLPLDLGGQWVGATHQRLLALLNAFGLTRYPTYYEGEGVFHWNGTAHRTGIEHDFGSSLLFFQPDQLGLPAAELAGALAVQRRFQQLVAQVPPQQPWAGPDAAALDRLSIGAWLERQGASELAGYPLAWLARMGGSGGFEPHESSILHLAWSQAVAPQQETPEAWLVQGGAAQVAERLAHELAGLIQLSATVGATWASATFPPWSSAWTALRQMVPGCWPASSPAIGPWPGNAYPRPNGGGWCWRIWSAGGGRRPPNPVSWCCTTGTKRAGAVALSPASSARAPEAAMGRCGTNPMVG